MNRPMFDELVDKIKVLVEVDDRGKKMEERSSGSFAHATLQLAATLRWLAGANHMCQEDNNILATSTFYDSVWRVVYALDAVMPNQL